jgi:hypothetical protein
MGLPGCQALAIPKDNENNIKEQTKIPILLNRETPFFMADPPFL